MGISLAFETTVAPFKGIINKTSGITFYNIHVSKNKSTDNKHFFIIYIYMKALRLM